MSQAKLWYDGPGEDWKQGLPIGNGRIGAVIYGGSERETWCMTELTYWSGKKERIAGNGGGKAGLNRMREAFYRGDYNEGDRLAKEQLQPKKQNFGTNLSVCDMVLRFGHQSEDIIRELDVEQATAAMSYSSEGQTFTREAFATNVDGIVAARFAGEQAESVSFTLRVTGRSGQFAAVAVGDDSIAFRGQAIEDMHSDGTCGVWCDGLVKLVVQGGSVQSRADKLVVTGADEAYLYFAMHTDYGQTDENWKARSGEQLAAAIAKGYDQLKADHVADYRSLYSRVALDLGASEAAALPTDERMRLLRQEGHDDPELISLFFQYGRYLTIAGSRANSPLPLHLQGIWNDGEANRMAWSCDYHLDINTQMNYYPTEIVNLAECHVPLMHYIERLAEAGRLAAKDFYDCEGWVAHVFSNAWGFAAPGWETGWGLNVTGGLWIAMHLKEHYEYGLDRTFLTEHAYPVMKEAAAFFLDYMAIHPAKGWLVTGPSNSPENSFYPADREQGPQQLSMGSTMDQVLVRDLFDFCLAAAKLLGTDIELQAKLEHAISLLPPLKIGSRGQLQEWLEDYEEAQPEHRHLAHLFALYPSSQINPRDTPELSAAARQTLLGRMTDELEDIEFTAVLFATGFSRLYDGDRALWHIAHLISELCFDNLLTYSKAGVAGADTNIFIADGNYGGTAAVADMLLHSHAGNIHLLPALPSAWRSGSFKGLRAKGSIEVDAAWGNNRLTEATLYAHASAQVVVRFGELAVKVELEAGQAYRLDAELQIPERMAVEQ
ncbi:glycoside hydrolase family 95 protein [Paenibacillus sp. Leaf72]|uniref:glycoside hydrolase family 95 protein n=1 Tax=Paenibacillus sp. Leaf72 TaxID=1736234 RepID=UPI0006FD3B3F|nr:glycoside hydrolase family 95 protein [Paenibacillus sp. Leaf72]KQO17214.1 alpha-L-fucosidase [Paenibacillus sp. Leaf72]